MLLPGLFLRGEKKKEMCFIKGSIERDNYKYRFQITHPESNRFRQVASSLSKEEIQGGRYKHWTLVSLPKRAEPEQTL